MALTLGLNKLGYWCSLHGQLSALIIWTFGSINYFFHLPDSNLSSCEGLIFFGLYL